MHRFSNISGSDCFLLIGITLVIALCSYSVNEVDATNDDLQHLSQTLDRSEQAVAQTAVRP